MPRRPLALVLGLAVGDYILWNWSLNANHDVLALVSGLTLPPLALASAWLLAVSTVRALGAATRRRAASLSARHARAHAASARLQRKPARDAAAQQAAAARAAPSRKLAA